MGKGEGRGRVGEIREKVWFVSLFLFFCLVPYFAKCTLSNVVIRIENKCIFLIKKKVDLAL